MRYISGCVSCGIFAIDSHMRGPIGVKLSGIVGANSENVLGPQKNCIGNTDRLSQKFGQHCLKRRRRRPPGE